MKTMWIWVLVIISVGLFFGSILKAAKENDDADFVLDSAGCAAAKHFGEPVNMADGICTVRASRGSFSFIELTHGGKIHKDHIVGIKE